MKIPYFLLENFMGVGRAELDLSNKGLVLLQGVNKDDPSAESNGAGKSSIADGLFWTLYGSTARDGLAADAVVNRKVGKNTRGLAILAEDDGSFYTVQRWRKMNVGGKRNGVSLTFTDPSGVVTDMTQGTDKLTQEKINGAIGASEEVFKAAVYAGQEQLPNLPAMTDLELKRLIEEASGVTTLVKAHEIAKKRLAAANAKQDIWRADHVRLESDVVAHQGRITDLAQRRDGHDGRRKAEVAALKGDLLQAVDRAKRARSKRDEVNVENVERAIAALDAKIDAVASENTQETNLHAALTDAAARLMTAKSVYQNLVRQAHDERAALDNINSRIGSPCGECGKPYCADDLEQATTLAKEKLRIAVERAREAGKDVEQVQTEETAARAALDAFTASKTDIRATVEERKRLAEMLATRATAVRDLERDTAEAQRIRAQIDAKMAEENPYGPLIDKAKEELTDALQAHRDSEAEGIELDKTVRVAKEVVKVYGPAGVRAHVLDTVTPYLNARTAEYLGAMSDGTISAVWSTISLNAKGEAVEKFAIAVDKPGDADSFAGLSGGEKRKVRLACALALQDLVASRATKAIDLWLGDEIDDAMDDAGLERLMGVLENKARERGTVVVISHNALNDWIRDCATVTRKDGLSTISGALDVKSRPVALAA